MAVSAIDHGPGARLALILILTAGLAGCDTGPFARGSGAGDDAAAPMAAGQTTELVELDVEAPEVFQATEQGLWDGRPSLGGVWVAHPDVTDPERVIIRNTETGDFVIGALFRRERDNPGPALQVSSDAAEALGMLAGAPAQLNVTALRREEAPPPEAALPEAALPPEGAEALAAAPEIAATPLDPLAGAAAAIDQAEAAGAATVPITAAPLDSAPVAAAPVALASAAPPPAASDLERPFIQIGIFSVQANADGAAADLDAQGLPARVVEGQVQGRTFWRVLVGPAASSAERATLLDRVKAEGFADAYFVRN